MSDLISRAAAIDALGERPMVWTDDDQYALGEQNQYDRDRIAIETLPCAEKVGKWIEVERGIHTTKYRCSDCGRIVWDDTGYDVVADYPYCNCGARMRGEENGCNTGI